MKLNELTAAPGSIRERKRIGRGAGSGNGKTAGKGHKGQKARAGRGMRPGFEGGQMPLQRRIPKRGFNNIFAKEVGFVNVGSLNCFEDGAEVDLAALKKAGLLRNSVQAVRILGNGSLSKKLSVTADAISGGAREKITAAGGTARQIASVAVGAINKFDNDAVVDLAALAGAGLIAENCDGVRILSSGKLTRKLTVKASSFTEAAKAKIEAAGGKAEVI